MPIPSDLVSQLRRRLKDERAGRNSFRFLCTDQSATDCTLTITRGGLLTTLPINARQALALSLDLSDPTYGTVRQLVDFMNVQPGYLVEVDRDFEPDHPAADLVLHGPASCLGGAVPIRCHLYSDAELEEFLRTACHRHNIRYTPATVPAEEETFVLMLAQSEAYRSLAGDAAKRANMEYTSTELLEMAEALEYTYKGDRTRQLRVIPVATPLDQSDTGRGEVITTAVYRRSMRTGWMGPIGAALEPIPVVLSVEDRDIEDTKVTLRWTRSREQQFYAYELWRDTRPMIERPPDVSTMTDVPEVLRDNTKRVYTAKLAMRSAGPHSIRERVGTIAILSEQGGQTINGFTDTGYTNQNPRGLGPATAPPLEPNTTYYYRMFVIGLNDVFTGSNEVVVTTKSMRPLFASLNALTPTAGPSGTVCTLRGTGFVAGMPAKFGDKDIVVTVIDLTTAVFVVPTFINQVNFVGLRYDIVIQDPVTGLIDVLGNGFQLNAS